MFFILMEVTIKPPFLTRELPVIGWFGVLSEGMRCSICDWSASISRIA